MTSERPIDAAHAADERWRQAGGKLRLSSDKTTDEPHDWHTIEIYFEDIAERDQAAKEIEQLLSGRGQITVHTWTALPGDPNAV